MTNTRFVSQYSVCPLFSTRTASPRPRTGAVCACLLLLLISVASTAQQATPRRDATALTFVSRVLTVAGGGTVVGAIADFSASGSIAYSWGAASVYGSATIKSRGAGQFRIDSQVPGGTLSMVVSNGTGALSLPDGMRSTIAHQDTLNVGNLTLPIICIYAAIQDTTVTIIDDGVVPLGSGQARKITIQQNFPEKIDPTHSLSADTKKDYFFDPSSFRLLQVRDTVPSRNYAVSGSIQHIIGFSNYQISNGILFPLSIAESVDGQSTWSLALTSVTFNTGLSDSDFQF